MAGDPKIEQPVFAMRIAHDVVRFYVPMNDANRFGCCESFEHMQAEVSNLRNRQSSRHDAWTQAAARHSLLADPRAGDGWGNLDYADVQDPRNPC
jgi:hypothetical protein